MSPNSGYEVDFAISCEEAIELYRAANQSGQAYDVVILDLTVPGAMGGKEAVLKLREIDFQSKIIVSSGYSNDPVLANHAAYGFDDFVVKPYKIRELSEAVHRVMLR